MQAHLPKADSFHPHFEEALHVMLDAGGKRFRPRLLLAVVQAYAPLLVPGAMPIAMAVEVMHTYSLIHDDLPAMDNADLRRGIPTLHKTYDEVTAVLAGDALNTHAFYLIADAPLPSETKVALTKELAWNAGIGGMVLGQAIDCHFEAKPLAPDQIDFLHIHKTGKLIASSLKMGAVIADLPSEFCSELYAFGLDLGLLFQIQDDIIDVTQSRETAGKTINHDMHKNSYVNGYGLEGALGRADELAKRIGMKLHAFEVPLKETLQPLLGAYIYRHKG